MQKHFLQLWIRSFIWTLAKFFGTTGQAHSYKLCCALKYCQFLKKNTKWFGDFCPDAKYLVQLRKSFPSEKIINITIVMCASLGWCDLLHLFPLRDGEEPSPARMEKGGQEGALLCNTMVFLHYEKNVMKVKYVPVCHPNSSSLTPKCTANWLLCMLRTSRQNPACLASRCCSDIPVDVGYCHVW